MNNLEKLRVVELDLLNEFVKICEKYDLKYYLAYGTLIGAVRHNGFIPWDDDIDVWMPRIDYDKFAEISKTELGEKYFYQNYNSDSDYPYNFAKIRMNGTRFVQKEISHLDMNHGIYIDLFPLDNARTNVHAEKRDWMINKILRTIASIRYMDTKKGGVKRSFLDRMIIIVTRTLISKNKIHYLIDKQERKLNSQASDKLIYRSDENWISFEKELFDDEKMMFEGKMYSVPKGYDKILTVGYGNYMQLPPENERVSNHETLEIDFGDYFDN